MRVVLRGATDGLAGVVDDDVQPADLGFNPCAELLYSGQVPKVDAVDLESLCPFRKI
jgi:hypothetical protein